MIKNRRDQGGVEKDQENAISGKQKDSVQEETVAVSATMGVNVKSQHQRPLLLQGREQKKTVKHLQEENASEVGVHPGC